MLGRSDAWYVVSQMSRSPTEACSASRARSVEMTLDQVTRVCLPPAEGSEQIDVLVRSAQRRLRRKVGASLDPTTSVHGDGSPLSGCFRATNSELWFCVGRYY
jgi:hypothetical protein